MKTTPFILPVAAFTSFGIANLFGQGALTPPGAPAPTMKSLDQIASTGIAINATNTPGTPANLYIISQPGSYYLTGNITGVSGKHGISIAASNVTVDLNGFAVTSPSSTTFNGIDVPSSLTNVTIRSGTVTGWHIGVNAAMATNGLFEQLQLSANGTGLSAGSRGQVKDCVSYANSGDGIDIPVGSAVSNCSASFNSGVGISTSEACTVSNCSVSSNTGNGIFIDHGSTVNNCAATFNANGISTHDNCVVSNCSARFNNGVGISTGLACTVTNCTASASGSNGISTGANSAVSGCSAYNNFGPGDGINVNSNCLVTGNNANSNNHDGIHATAGGNRIESNIVWNNVNAGIEPAGTNQKNVIIKNSAGNNNSGTNNYALASGNSDYGPFSSNPSTATNPLTNFQ